jgi:hypothetical protein
MFVPRLLSTPLATPVTSANFTFSWGGGVTSSTQGLTSPHARIVKELLPGAWV